MAKKLKKIKLPEEFRAWLVGFLGFIVMCIIVFLSAICSGCTNNIKAVSQQEEITRAYNHLLHRIWIDNPNYVEDVLVESDEWVSLNQLVNSDFYDVFELKTKSDSITYDLNWEKGN